VHELLSIGIEAAAAGAAVIREGRKRLAQLEWTTKGPADFVTEVDRRAEAAIASVISLRLPSARIVGEELSPQTGPTSGITFIVDPIDGTTNFLHDYPEYAVSIGVVRDGAIVAGVVQNVPRNELFTATAGGGAFRDGARIHVSEVSLPSRALLATGFPFKHREYMPVYLAQLQNVLTSSAGVRRAGSAALDLANVACGRFDAFWELMLAPWDVAAGILLVREAGGMVTNLEGAQATPVHAPLVASNGHLHHWLLHLLAQPRPADKSRPEKGVT
jgi:myo-inositol-1(or 4)-monophosphatase